MIHEYVKSAFSLQNGKVNIWKANISQKSNSGLFFLSLFAKQIRKAFLHLVVQKSLLGINKFVTKAFLNKKPMKNIMKNYLLLRLYIKIQ